MTRNRFENWSQNLSQVSAVAKQVGAVANTLIDSIAEFGAFIPLLEIIVTIAAFYAAGLGAMFGVEVLVGLVFAQLAALYLTAHYRGVAMSGLGLASIFLSIIVGAANTGLAVFLALNAHSETGIPQLAWQFPAFSAALAVLFMYGAKMFTHEQVANRRRLAVEATNELAEIKRRHDAQTNMNTTRDNMLQTRADMEETAMNELANDPRMQAIQKRAMWITVVKDIMNQYDVRENSKLGKQLLGLADEAVSNDGQERPFSLGDLDRIFPEAEKDFLSQNGRRQPQTNGNGRSNGR